jgi:hypothetical protein
MDSIPDPGSNPDPADYKRGRISDRISYIAVAKISLFNKDT